MNRRQRNPYDDDDTNQRPPRDDGDNTSSYDEPNTDIKDEPKQEMIDVSNDPILNADVFKNRREMAWWSLYMLIGLIAVLFVFLFVILGLFLWTPASMVHFTSSYKVYLDWSSTFIGWGISAFVAVILAYMGVSAYFYNSYMSKMKK